MTDTGPLALITGASSGIGYQLALQFTTHGYDVIVAAEDDGILPAAASLAREGASAEAVQVEPSTNPTGRWLRRRSTRAWVAGAGSSTVTSLLRGDRKVVAESLSTKAIGLANRVLPDSVKAVTNRVLSAPVSR